MPAASFSTAIGRCALAWERAVITAIELPGTRPSPASSPAGGDPMPRWAREVAERIAAHLDGIPDDLRDVPLAVDTVAGAFRRLVYATARSVDPGRTVTYGQLAALAGRPGAARAVGGALAANPFPLVVPCHRVLAAGGGPGGFSAPGGLATKARLLAIEGVELGLPPGSP